MTGGVALIVVCELVEVEGSVPVGGEIRTVTTDHQTNHNDNYVNYSILLFLTQLHKNAISFPKLIIILISHKKYKNIFTMYINYTCTLYYVHVTNLI